MRNVHKKAENTCQHFVHEEGKKLQLQFNVRQLVFVIYHREGNKRIKLTFIKRHNGDIFLPEFI